MSGPLKIDRFIQLLVREPLDAPQMRAWMAAAQATAPSGVLATVQATDDQGGLSAVRMVHKTGDGHVYQIPLTRDLGPDEVQRIVDDFADRLPDLDFDIETSATRIDNRQPHTVSGSDQQHLATSLAIAKARHAAWMRERIAAGWRYGTRFSTREKTHQLLLPWEQLPDQFRVPDLDAPQAILDLVQAQGYTLIPTSDLDRLRGEARRC